MAHWGRKQASAESKPIRQGTSRAVHSTLNLPRPSSLLRGCCALRTAALQLAGRNQHFGGHARHERAFGIVHPGFQHDGFDIAFAAAHVTLRGEVSLYPFKENFAA